MTRASALIVIGAFLSMPLSAQNASPPTGSTPSKKAKKHEKSSAPNLPGAAAQSNEPTTTEIYADEAFFDSNKNKGIFSGHVKVIDPRFNLQSDKLTIFVSKGQTQGLEKAIAEGNVAVVRDRPDPNGGPPSRAVGRAETGTYVARTGDMELKGDPRVQEGLNTHVAASPDTVMIINQNGQLTTHGPSRTEIRQQPKETPASAEATAGRPGESKPNESPSPAATLSPKP
jgi:lipopolysaccharide transport protein LptA